VSICTDCCVHIKLLLYFVKSFVFLAPREASTRGRCNISNDIEVPELWRIYTDIRCPAANSWKLKDAESP
jgi:hypothetical protein